MSRFIKYLLPVVVACGMSTALTASSVSASEASPSPIDERDAAAMKNWMMNKRTMPVGEKADRLSISGEVRAEWKNMSEKENNNRVRGSGSFKGVPDEVRYSRNEYDVEVNMMMRYQTERTWAAFFVSWDNDAGMLGPIDNECGGGSGTKDAVCVPVAYFGYNIFEHGSSRLDVEMGRLGRARNVFDSKVQFQDIWDGVLLKYSNSFEDVSDFYVMAGPALVNEVSDHFAWHFEIGFLDIMDAGVDLKYSYVSYARGGLDSAAPGVVNPASFQFKISQFTAAYNLPQDLLRMKARLYGAYLINHDADSKHIPGDKDLDEAWYIGFTIGEIVRAGSWSFDFNWQHVEAQSIMDSQVSGIGLGNVRGNCLYNGSPYLGNTNYEGWHAELLYALTDTITVDMTWDYSWEENSYIMTGIDSYDFSMFEVEFIYAW